MVFDDGTNVRKLFPIFEANPTLSYLDSASSSQKPQIVIDKIVDLYTNKYSNVHRGVYKLSYDMTLEYNRARKICADYINAKAKNISFTRNATEGINLFSQAWARNNLSQGDVILISTLEHHANIVPWQKLCEEIGTEIFWIHHNDDYSFDEDWLDHIPKNILDKTKIFSITAASNVTGTLPNIKEMISKIKTFNSEIIVCVDACQYNAHNNIDVIENDIDVCAFSAHKIFGPTGIGCVFLNDRVLEHIKPYQVGGGMIDNVTFEGYTPTPPPELFEAGVPAFVEAIAFGEAINFATELRKIDGIKKNIDDLAETAINILEETLNIDNYKLVIHKPKNEKSLPIISFSTQLAHPHDIAQVFGEENVCVRAGHHCAKPLMKALGENATTRISLTYYNNEEDIFRLKNACEQLVNIFK